MRCLGIGPIGQADSEVCREDGLGAGEDGRVRIPVGLQQRHLGAVGVRCKKEAWMDVVLKALMTSRWSDGP